MWIGELSHLTGASVRSLRYYEQQGLLHPARTPSGYRTYAPEAVEAVRIIQTLLAAGLSSCTIRELLPCVRMAGGQATPCSDLLADLNAERQRIDTQIESLTASRSILDTIIDAAD